MDTAQVERRDFVETLKTGHGAFGRTVFRAHRSQSLNDYIRVDFDLDWPENIRVAQTPSEHQVYHVATALFRVKSLLEQSLMQDLSLFDVVEGCLKVRYALTEPSSQDLVHRAIARLLAQRQLYSVTNATGHIDGRNVK